MLNRDSIIRMARVAGLPEAIIEMTPEAFERFAFAIAAHENEHCAKLLESTDLGALKNDPLTQLWIAGVLNSFAKAIRERT